MVYERSPIASGVLLAETDRRSSGYIRWVQDSLNRVTRAGLVVDGVIGPRTRAAVAAFQLQRGLVADGVVGPRTEAALVAAGATPPPSSGSTPVQPTPVTPTAPGSLVKRETSPPAVTLYTSLTLGGESPARALTGIFVPDGYRPRAKVDLILYLHGHKDKAPEISIDTYWNRSRYPLYALREPTNDAGKNVILAAPTLGPRSQAGWLTGPGGLDRYVDHVMSTLHAHGPWQGPGAKPSLGNLILACHSGGGVPMRKLAFSTGPAAASLRECWGFDCLYNKGDDAEWERWARSRPDARLFIHFLGGTGTYSRALRARAQSGGLANVSVMDSSARFHGEVPMAHWRQRLAAAPFLALR